MARIPSHECLDIPSGAVETLAATDGTRDGRDFRMLAYTGAEFDRFYGRVIVDLAGMQVASDKMPILVEHQRDRRAGVATSTKVDAKGLVVAGRLLDNEHGAALAKDSAQGFPFQASMGVSFQRVEELEDGDEKQVNGRTFSGPGYVVTKSRVLECSFVTLGADGATRAEAFAADAAQTIETTKKEPQAMSESKTDAAAVDAEALKKDAATAERARAKAIREALAGHPEVALLAIEEGDSVVEARARLGVKLAAENADLRGRLEKAEKAALTPPIGFAGGVRDGANTGAAPVEDLSKLPAEERAAKEWSTRPDIREEFAKAGGKSAYEAFLRAEAAGQVKILEPMHGQYGH